jgi:hypothetical protein
MWVKSEAAPPFCGNQNEIKMEEAPPHTPSA